ncbi:MAG: hypothetical protein AB7O65_06240 [Candidatus Korobacteraceae bacterium]
MSCRCFVAATVALACGALLFAAIVGVFRGVIVEGPGEEPGYIYLRGRNGQLRRVLVTSARVSYATSFPKQEREKEPRLSLREGVEVRVTAKQDDDGEWRATDIEILGRKH